MYNSMESTTRSDDGIERGIWANAPFTPERNHGTRGMQMLVIYGALTWAVIGVAFWLSGVSLW